MNIRPATGIGMGIGMKILGGAGDGNAKTRPAPPH